MDLKAAVEKYLAVVKEFGQPMPLAEFDLLQEELEALLASWEEDYQLHRHFELIPAANSVSRSPGEQKEYTVYGIAYTAIVFQPSIYGVLG